MVANSEIQNKQEIINKQPSNKKIRKALFQILSIILAFALLSALGIMIIYPNLTNLKIRAKSFDFYKIARNTSLKVFTRISKPQSETILILESEETTIENISENELKRFEDAGNKIIELEPLGTILEIPTAEISGKVFDGDTANTLSEGIWHYPISVAPGARGNSVIIAHRFDKLPPATDTFFNLDKVEVGDKIIIEQENDKFTYTVIETKVVERNDRSVLRQTYDHRITLITCTPLWTGDQRLVVIGKLDKVYGNI